MRNWVAACLFGIVGLAAPASAMPVAPLGGLDDGNLTLIAQGCGVGGFRGPYGRCHYGAAPGVYVAPHRGPYYGPRPYVRPYYGHPRVYGAPYRRY
jgi:hypothetical protein